MIELGKRDLSEGETVNWSDKRNKGEIKADVKLLI